MTNKKAEWKRIAIFVIISFALTWIPEIILNKTVGFDVWFSDSRYGLLGILLMFPPAAANLITRALTKEGMKNSFLHLNLKGNIKFYLIALLLPVLIGAMSGICIELFFGKPDFGSVLKNASPTLMAGLILNILSLSAVMAWYAFGEEFGWRAYLYPKLEKLIGTPWACLLGGVIWGLWHMPLTAEGHNYGRDYWGFPWLGIILMTVSCVADGFILMWLTKKSGSIFPAAIFHACGNSGGSSVSNFFIVSVDLNKTIEIYQWTVFMIPEILFGIICFILLIRESKKANQ